MSEGGCASRREAIFVVAQWLETKKFPDRMISDSPDRGFVTDLVYTAVRHFRTLDWMLGQLVKKMPVGESRAALLVGAAQLLKMRDVKEYAAVHETVAAAKLASKASAGFVNGVLRNLIRNRERLENELTRQSPGVRYSHPDALVVRWLERYGAKDTAALCAWDNTPADTFLAYPPASGKDFVKLEHGRRVEDVEGYADGAFIVQDPATAGAIELLDVKPGMRVLDACAAPGGKTVQIGWRMGGRADGQKLVAMDLREDRLEAVRDNLKRTKMDWVEVKCGDLADDVAALKAELGTFDRILIDAPCSNTGVLRRRPDARWRWSGTRMKQLAETQQSMLIHGMELLAPGGLLVYSTCSLEPEENRRQINLLRKRYPNLQCRGVVERLPFRNGTDGAFACALERPEQP